MTKNIPLVTALIQANITGKAAAEEAKVSPTSFSLILNNRRRPKPDTAKRIAAVFKMKPDHFGWKVSR